MAEGGDGAARADLRAQAEAVWRAGLAAAAPGSGVRRALRAEPFEVAGRLRALAVGKAAAAMAEAAGPVDAGLLVSTAGAARAVEGFEARVGEHPVPGAGSAAAAARVEGFVAGAGPEDGLLVLLSGGASALMAAPVQGVSPDELARTHELLLASGAPIGVVNLIRRRLLRLSGGRLAWLARRARVRTLVLSDVVGDALWDIGSGPTAPEPVGPESAGSGGAQAAAEALGLRGALPAAVWRALGRRPDPEVAAWAARVEHRIVGGGRQSAAAAAEAAEALGYGVTALGEPVVGEAVAAGRALAAQARAAMAGSAGPGALVGGGETTVRVVGSGRGGRCQELALGFALGMQGCGRAWAMMSAGTDGRDGPTDAAGALVDGGSLDRARGAGCEPVARLADNDSYAAHEAAGDLVRTGATGTNVGDLQVILWR